MQIRRWMKSSIAIRDDRSPTADHRISIGCRLHALAARADHRLDELVVGVLVAAIISSASGCRAVRPLVVAAGEVERADRVVRGPDDEEAGDPAARTARARRARPPPRTTAATRRRGRGRRAAAAPARAGRATRAPPTPGSTCSTPARPAPRAAASRLAGPVAQPVGLAAPVAFGRERERVRLGRERHASARRATRVEQVIARHARQIEHLGPPRLGRLGSSAPANRSRRRGSRDQREHQVAARVEVVRRRSAARETRAGRGSRPAARRSGARARPAAAASAARRREPDPTRRSSSASIAGVGDERRPAAARHQNGPRCRRAARPEPCRDDRGDAPAAPSTQQHQPRQPGRQRVGRERAIGEPRGTARPARWRAPTPTSVQQEVEREHDQRRARSPRAAAATQRHRRPPAPSTVDPQRRPPAVEAARPRRAPEALSSQSRCAAVDRGEQRADRRRRRGRRRGRA